MYSEKAFEHGISLLRIALGVIFFWFGALKLAGFNHPAEFPVSLLRG